MFELILEITLGLGGISVRVSRNLYLRVDLLHSYLVLALPGAGGEDVALGLVPLRPAALRAAHRPEATPAPALNVFLGEVAWILYCKRGSRVYRVFESDEDNAAQE